MHHADPLTPAQKSGILSLRNRSCCAGLPASGEQHDRFFLLGTFLPEPTTQRTPEGRRIASPLCLSATSTAQNLRASLPAWTTPTRATIGSGLFLEIGSFGGQNVTRRLLLGRFLQRPLLPHHWLLAPLANCWPRVKTALTRAKHHRLERGLQRHRSAAGQRICHQ